MTHHDTDPRQIAGEHEAYNCRLVRRVDQTDDLAYFWVKTDGPPIAFEPGQYLTIGVFADGKLVQRPYSVASARPVRPCQPALRGSFGRDTVGT